MANRPLSTTIPLPKWGPRSDPSSELTGLGGRCQAYPKTFPFQNRGLHFWSQGREGWLRCRSQEKEGWLRCPTVCWRQCSTVPGCRRGLLVKWRPRSWCADELLKAPALLGGEGRPLLRHCIVTRESGSLAGWRTVSWLLAVDERRWFERVAINCVPTRRGASLVRESRTGVDASHRLAGCSC